MQFFKHDGRRPWATCTRTRSTKFSWAVFLTLGLPAPLVLAEDPLSVDELTTPPGAWKITGGVTYLNGQNAAFKITRTTPVQGASGLIAVPAAIDEEKSNIDIVLPALSIRYGLPSGLEVFAQLRGYWYSRRSASEDVQTTDNHEHTHSQTTANQTHSDLLGVALGASKKLYEQKHVRGLLAFVQVALDKDAVTDGERAGSSSTWVTGLSAYRVIDPVFLSLSASVVVAGARTVEGDRVDPGDALAINPALGFAVNSDLTLSAGLNWFLNSRDKINGEHAGIDRTSTSLGFGIIYASSEHWVSSYSIATNISGAPAAQWNAALTYRIDEAR